jgi:hypothetical protein
VKLAFHFVVVDLMEVLGGYEFVREDLIEGRECEVTAVGPVVNGDVKSVHELSAVHVGAGPVGSLKIQSSLVKNKKFTW